MAAKISERRGLMGVIFMLLTVCAVAIVMTRCRPDPAPKSLPVSITSTTIDTLAADSASVSVRKKKSSGKRAKKERRRTPPPARRSPLDEPV